MDLTILTPIIIEFCYDYPKIAAVIAFMGAMRVFAKPVVSCIREIIVLTPSKKDDVWLDKQAAKGWVRAVLYVVDWVSSIKITPKKKIEKEKS